MGIVSTGIPRELTLRLAAAVGSKAFVETGTYRGGTTRWAAEHFARVYTIEKASTLFDAFSPELARLPGVRTIFGDSRNVLPEVMKEIGDEPALIWLDGHWSGGDTSGLEDECPVLEELQCLAHRPSDIILIDDARFFLAAPPRPHNPCQWPTIVDLVVAFDSFGEGRLLQVIDDVIVLVPNVGNAREVVLDFAQRSAVSAQAANPIAGIVERLRFWTRRRLSNVKESASF